MTSEMLGYAFGQIVIAIFAGLLVAWLIRRTARTLPEPKAKRRRRIGVICGVLVALLFFLAPAVNRAAADEATDTAEQVAGFTRGFNQRCLEQCTPSDDAQCVAACTCLKDELATRIDRERLYEITRTKPTQDIITAYALANRDAIIASYDTCNVTP